MIKLKKELMEANEITKELDKSLISLMKKYENDEIRKIDITCGVLGATPPYLAIILHILCVFGKI